MPASGSKPSALSEIVEFVSSRFDEVDNQHRGFIASGQLRELLERLGAAPQPLDQIRSIALLLDPDYSDKIQKQDFLRFWITREMAPQRERGDQPASSSLGSSGGGGGGGGGAGFGGAQRPSSEPGANGRSFSGGGSGRGAGTPAPPSAATGGSGGPPSGSVVAELTEAARARKEAQENAKLLSNRVAMLREEKLKAIRCIADANRQAEKITAFKRKQEERRLERREIAHEQEERAREAMQEFADRKQKSYMIKAAKAEQIYRQRVQAAAEVREQKFEALKDKKRVERQYRNRARETHAGVLELHRSLRLQKTEIAQQQYESGQRAYGEKIKAEERLRKKNERSISALEEEEAGLIQELQNAQLMQEDALSGLQYLLSTRVLGTE